MQQSYRFTVHGLVQGVGYRAATERRARALGLAGWVMNRADGAVEGLAAGTDEALGVLRDWLAQGPPLARVSRVDWQAAAATGPLPQPFATRR